MLLNCPNCKSPLGGPAINIPKNIAHCPECDHVFRISDAMDQEFNNDHKTRIIMPDGIEMVPGLQLDIKLKWRKLSRVTMYFVIGGIITCMMLIFGYVVSLESSISWVYLLLSLFFMIGLSFLFKAFSNFVNTTYLTVSSFDLQVDHRPINFFGWRDRVIPKGEIVQLFVQRYVESTTNDRPNYAYNLLIVLKDGREEKLITGLKKAEVAFYIEHQIEKRLGLEDRPAVDEYIPGQSDNRLLLRSLQQVEQMPKFLRNIVQKQLSKEEHRKP